MNALISAIKNRKTHILANEGRLLKKSFYGINCGSIGFLMNNESKTNLEKIIKNSQKIKLKPLNMIVKSNKGEKYTRDSWMMRTRPPADEFEEIMRKEETSF